MAPASTDSPSQADTPMTDANDDAIPSVPVDAPTVSDARSCPAVCRCRRIITQRGIELTNAEYMLMLLSF